MRFLVIGVAVFLTGCGGDTVPQVTSSGRPLPAAQTSSARHSCENAVLSGSPEQEACFEAARKACPAGTFPKQIDFTQPEEGPQAGMFLISGYGCV